MSLIVKDLVREFNSSKANDVSLKILDHVNFEIMPGEVVAIVGQSGSGKTTLLSLLAGLDKPTTGTLSLDGVTYSELKDDQMTRYRAEKISMVFQQYHLVSYLTALENVELPLLIKGDSDATIKATELLRQMQLSERMDHFPSQLSGGEAQRVGIARALVTNPQLLLADEPSGNLDPATGDSVMDVFFETVRKRKATTLLVTHNISLAKKCDRILSLVNGQLISKVLDL